MNSSQAVARGTSAAPVPSVLIVDDTPVNLRVLAGALRDEGYRVRPISDGPSALAAAEHDPPTLVLLDVSMPGMDGFDVCRAFKASEQLHEVPIIFISALSDIDDKIRAFEHGGVDYITKPFRLEEVRARVRTHVALRRFQIEQQELARIREDLAHMVAHDMRNPLAVITGSADLLASTPDLPPAALRRARLIQHQAGRLDALLNDLLVAAKLEHGKLQLYLQPVELDRVLEQAIVDQRTFAEARKIEARLTLPAGSPVIHADVALLRRVLDNLLENAIKFSDPGSEVGLSAEAFRGAVRIRVSDLGPGVPVDLREKIFGRFETARLRLRGVPQTGLGLAFAKLAVEAHGGRIFVEANEPRGSVFIVELPEDADVTPGAAT